MADFLLGLRTVLEALGLLRAPGLRRFVLVPLLVNILLFTGAIVFAWQGLDAWLDTLLPQWLEWAAFVLLPLLALVLLIVVFFSFTFVAQFIAGPFNGLLAARVEARETGRRPPQGEAGLLRELVAGLGGELRRLGFGLAWMVGLLLLSLIPVVNLLAVVFGAWLLAVEYADAPMGNHGIGFRQQRERLRQRRMLSLGMGAGIMVLTLVPVLNFFAMPAGVVAATLVWSRELAPAE